MRSYIYSNDFKSLCVAMDFLDEDIDEIRRKVSGLNRKDDFKEKITLIIYNQLLKYKQTPSKEVHDKVRYFRWLSDDESFSRDELSYQVLIRDENKWEDIKNKLDAGIRSGKINSDYLFEKEFYHELDLIEVSEYKNASNIIYLHEMNYLLNSYNLPEDVKKAIIKDSCYNGGYYGDPLYFNDLKNEVKKVLELVLTEPCIEIRDYSDDTLWISYMFVKNKKLAEFIDGHIQKNDESYSKDPVDTLFTYPSYFKNEMAFYVITCGDSSEYKHRSNFSDIYIIKKNLIENCEGLLEDQSSGFVDIFDDYVDESFHSSYQLELTEQDCIKYDDFKITRFTNPEDGKTWHIFDKLYNEKHDYDHENLFEIASQKPLSEEFLSIISSLNMSIDDAYIINNLAEDSGDVVYLLNRKILEDNDDKRILSQNVLAEMLDEFYIKCILASKENRWEYIKADTLEKIANKKIKSANDLNRHISEMIKTNFKINILNAQIFALFDFKELDYSYGEKLAFYLRDKDILNNGLAEFLNDLMKSPEIEQKEYLDEGKYAAPRWLVYPELDAYTMGWRMGYGEAYAMNEPWHTPEFEKLFPRPKNWLFNPSETDFDNFPPLGYFWTSGGRPKYSKITADEVKVNDFITVDKQDLKFQYNAKSFKSIEHAVLAAKYALFDKIDYYQTSYNTLKRGFKLNYDQVKYWENFKYAVLLNACYYKIMQDENLRKKLLSTGDACLVYESDDEWGGDENLFGFALMELRDEIRRLYENEDLIDWQYTEYLKEKDPYESPQKRNPNDEQSHEFIIVSSILSECDVYVRDCNLSDELIDKYEKGQILTERSFTDASSQLGGMITNLRYLILSNQMSDFSAFEKDTNWGVHTAKADSKFKVLDIYKKEDKTQILLIHILEGFEEAFEMQEKIFEDIIGQSRSLFDICMDCAPVEDLNDDAWLERVSFPIGMDDNGNFY